MTSNQFAPTVELTAAQVRGLMADRQSPRRIAP
jgi:hypothetical protein